MRHTVKMPRVADTTDEVMVAQWLVAVGDDVAVGQDLLSVETDKAQVAVPSPVAGTVAALLVAAEDEIVTGAPLLTIESAS